MKAPDKIYLQELSDGTWDDCFVYESSETDTKGMKRVPYIRKEALLKFLNNYKTVLNNDEELYHSEKAAAVYAIEEVINHINEM